MSDWLAEGVSTRTRFGHPSPVVHLVITEREELWCTGSRGRVASIHHQSVGAGYAPPRTCKTCTALAADAIANGMLDQDEVPRFVPAG